MRNYSDHAGRGIFVFRSGIQQAIAGALAMAILPLSFGTALGQEGPQPEYEQEGAPQSNYLPQGPGQLDQLVAPIALYPDSLVAQVLAGATYPAQLQNAEQFVQESGNYPPEQLAEQANTEPWDPSVKALVAFPQVLANLNQNLQWTVQLGNAYYNQPQDVLNAVQVMRQRAYAAGNLRPTQQLNVIYQPDDIVIAPVSPTIVYVPYYNPWVVYGEPLVVYPHYYYGPPRGISFGTGLALGFGLGIAIGAFTHFGWGYHSWQPDWRSHAVLYQHNTYISNSVTVINHGNYGHYDRAPEARAFNQQQAARYSNAGNRTTINNVTVNRGGNTFNNGGNGFNRGPQTSNNGGNGFNRGPQTLNNGGNTYNRGGNTLNNGGNTLNNGGNTVNRGSQTFNNGGNTANRGSYPGQENAVRAQGPQQPFNRPVQPTPPQINRGTQQAQQQQYNRPVQPVQQQQQYNRPVQQAPQQQYNRPVQQAPQQQYNRPVQQAPQQQQYNRPVQQAPQQPSRPAPQQAPQQQHSAPQQHSDGGGHDNHDNHGGGHDDHHR